MQPPDSRQRWVSFDEARMILRMSEGTLRRAIRDGKVIAEQRRRNPDSPTDQRMVYEVLVTEPPDGATASESDQAPTSATEPPALTTRLLDKLDERDETIARLSAENADLRERVGHAETRAELEAQRAERLEADNERLRARLERPWWRFW